MSDRPCNFCILQEMKKKHGEENVQVKYDPKMKMDQVWVKGHPTGTWFMFVGKSCAC
jgi:hypothetical protein